MENDAGWEIASVILIHKIKNMAQDEYSDLGLLTLRDVKNGILPQFKPYEVETATEYAAQHNVLDIYYDVKCYECGNSDIIIESNGLDKVVAGQIVGRECNCSYCGHVIYSVDNYTDLDKFYAVSNDLLMGGGDQSVPSNETTIHRTFRWMTSWLTRGS